MNFDKTIINPWSCYIAAKRQFIQNANDSKANLNQLSLHWIRLWKTIINTRICSNPTKQTLNQIDHWPYKVVESSRKFPLNYLSCLFYILKPQNATTWSLFYTLHDVCFTNEATKVQFLRKRRFISAVGLLKNFHHEDVYIRPWPTADTRKNAYMCPWPG